MIQRTFRALVLPSWLALMSCRAEAPKGTATSARSSDSLIEAKLAQYTTVSLTTDLTKLSSHERQMLPLLIAAARSEEEIDREGSM